MLIYKISIEYSINPDSNNINWKKVDEYGDYERIYKEDLSLNLDNYDINDIIDEITEYCKIEEKIVSRIFDHNYFEYSDDYEELAMERVDEDIKSDNIFVRINIEVYDEYKYIKGLKYHEEKEWPKDDISKLENELWSDFHKRVIEHDKHLGSLDQYITSHKYTYDYNNKNIIDKTYNSGCVIDGGYNFNGLDTVSQEFFDTLKVGSLVSVRLYDYDMKIHKGIVLLKDCEDINIRTEFFMLKIFTLDLDTEEYDHFVVEPSWIVSVDGYDEEQANSLIEKYKDINLLNN